MVDEKAPKQSKGPFHKQTEKLQRNKRAKHQGRRQGPKDRAGQKGRKGQKRLGKQGNKKTFFDLMGPPPLLSDEDPAQYYALYEMLRLKLKPRDIIEEFYVRQIMDDAWLVTRYRRMNSHLLNMARPALGDEIRLKIDRYRNTFMGSEDLLDQRTENLILHDFSQLACTSHPSDMIAKHFENKVVEINLIEGMISRCLERMRRSHLTLEDFRSFMDTAITLTSQKTLNPENGHCVKDSFINGADDEGIDKEGANHQSAHNEETGGDITEKGVTEEDVTEEDETKEDIIGEEMVERAEDGACGEHGEEALS